jgi:hypothetical protein
MIEKLRESVALVDARIDKAAGIVRGVKVLGLVSKNGRKYTPAAARAAIPLLENARVYIDHPDGESNARKYGERFARLRNVRQDAAGDLFGDLRYNTAHPHAKSFEWAVEHDPREIGLSINADGVAVREADGTKRVEQITAVHSVDIVDGPATVEGLFEQTRSPARSAADLADEMFSEGGAPDAGRIAQHLFECDAASYPDAGRIAQRLFEDGDDRDPEAGRIADRLFRDELTAQHLSEC